MIDSTWTWIAGNVSAFNINGDYGEKGIASPSNYPGARCYPVGIYDRDNQEFWLFGGEGYDSEGNHGTSVDVKII